MCVAASAAAPEKADVVKVIVLYFKDKEIGLSQEEIYNGRGHKQTCTDAFVQYVGNGRVCVCINTHIINSAVEDCLRGF